MPPPLLLMTATQVIGLGANILNHRATRLFFENNASEVALANSCISCLFILIVMGSVELISRLYGRDSSDMPEEQGGSSSSIFQGPVFIGAAILANPIIMLNSFTELGYKLGSAIVYTHSLGVILKVVASLVAGLAAKLLLTVLGLESEQSAYDEFMFGASFCISLVGVFLLCSTNRISSPFNKCRTSTKPYDFELLKKQQQETDEVVCPTTNYGTCKKGSNQRQLLSSNSNCSLSSLLVHQPPHHTMLNMDTSAHTPNDENHLQEPQPSITLSSMSFEEFQDDLSRLETEKLIDNSITATTPNNAITTNTSGNGSLVYWTYNAMGFVTLIASHALWTVLQVWINRNYDVDALGYVSLDQVYGGVFSIGAILLLDTCSSQTQIRPPTTTNDEHSADGSSSSCKSRGLLKQSFCRKLSGFCTGDNVQPMGYLIAANILSNAVIAIQFTLNSHYEPSLVLLEMALIRVSLGAFYTAVVSRYFPSFLDLSIEERENLISTRYALQQVFGLALVILSLGILQWA